MRNNSYQQKVPHPCNFLGISSPIVNRLDGWSRAWAGNLIIAQSSRASMSSRCSVPEPSDYYTDDWKGPCTLLHTVKYVDMQSTFSGKKLWGKEMGEGRCCTFTTHYLTHHLWQVTETWHPSLMLGIWSHAIPGLSSSLRIVTCHYRGQNWRLSTPFSTTAISPQGLLQILGGDLSSCNT